MHPDAPSRTAGAGPRGARAGLALIAVLALSVIPAGPAASTGRASAARPSSPAALVVAVRPGTRTRAAVPVSTSQHGFRFRDTVVPMRLPLPPGAAYTYVNNFLAPRVGVVYPFEHVRGAAPDGTLLRAHDGVDVYVATGTPVLAPFSGTVLDPATRWRPWDRSRYGLVAAVVSDEPASRGYAVLLVHLSRLAVRPGQHVVRGQRLGLTGRTGNAAGTPAHLHVELRAPFLLVVHEHGIVRRIDAFDPYPSLLAADPHR
jgi:murein DD-endopeptidase MepM/ murein hydrolase activator NlpD